MDYTFQFGPLLNYLPQFISGFWLTMLLAFVGIFGGIAVGVGCAVASTLPGWLPRFLVRCYVEAMRNTPLLVQIFVIFFGLPNIGVRMSPLTSVFIALVLNNGGYIAEIVRGGIQATHRSQLEAAESLGMTYFQTLRFVILPPALEKVFTPVVSQCVLLMLSNRVGDRRRGPDRSCDDRQFGDLPDDGSLSRHRRCLRPDELRLPRHPESCRVADLPPLTPQSIPGDLTCAPLARRNSSSSSTRCAGH